MVGLFRYGLSLGVGLAIGAAAIILLDKKSSCVKKAAVKTTSHALELKEKTSDMLKGIKSNFSDIKTEAKKELVQRKKKSKTS